jgi:hypothetical protein
LRNDPELWAAVFDIAFSAAGFLRSPLFFTYHLTRMANLKGASIVIRSITTNKARLLTTMMLAITVMYLFALFGALSACTQQQHAARQ